MTELNQKKFEVTVKDPYTLEIPVDSSSYSDYVRGGYINPLKKPVSVNFHPYTYALKHPGQFICDFVKIDRAPLLHLAFQSLHRFLRDHGRRPKAGNRRDSSEFFRLCE
eukprot:gene2742-3343_t